MKTAVFLLALVAYVRGQYTCHGDVTKIHPTGASNHTASQDGLHLTGVEASQHMVDADLAELNKRKTCYVQAGDTHCIHPAVIAGIASRETKGGELLYSTGGWGDNHRAWGIMQCDVHTSGLGSQCTDCGWDSCCHIEMMTKDILVPFINQVKSKHPHWTPEEWLQGGVSAYNAGVDNVQTVAGMDIGTTGDDYSNDVIARAQWLISQHGW